MASDERETETPLYHRGTIFVEKIRNDEFLLLFPNGETAICDSLDASNKAIKGYWRSHRRPGHLNAGRAVLREHRNVQ